MAKSSSNPDNVLSNPSDLGIWAHDRLTRDLAILAALRMEQSIAASASSSSSSMMGPKTSTQRPTASPVPPMWRDPRFPSAMLRDSGPGRVVPNGPVHAGLINLGSLLGVGRWGGLPNRQNTTNTMTDLAADPWCAADMIVSVLYRYRPSALEEFFCATTFTYVHRYDGEHSSQVPEGFERFVIMRRGSVVTAGFCTETAASGAISRDGISRDGQWTSYVMYELQRMRAGYLGWRAMSVLEPGKVTPHADADDPSSATDCDDWESWAVMALAPALVQRRWMERPGASRIEVDSSRDAAVPPAADDEEHTRPRSAVSEANFHAEGKDADDSESGGSAPQTAEPVIYWAAGQKGTTVPSLLNRWRVGEKVPFLSGTSIFCDVNAMMRAAAAEVEMEEDETRMSQQTKAFHNGEDQSMMATFTEGTDGDVSDECATDFQMHSSSN